MEESIEPKMSTKLGQVDLTIDCVCLLHENVGIKGISFINFYIALWSECGFWDFNHLSKNT